MSFGADILIVAGQGDGVADRLRRDLAKIGHQASVLDGPAAARLFTIRVTRDEVAVTPSIPTLVRSSAWWYDFASATSDERFLRGEAYAAFWAAMALSKSVVINRIGPGGGIGRVTAGALAAATGSVEPYDIHTSGPEFIQNDPGETLWGEDLEFRVASVEQLREGEPLRARKLNPAALYEIVTVVGDRAFSATIDVRSSELGVLARSLELCKRLEVHFATVTWAIDAQGATPIRLNAAPEEAELRYAWREISAALCEDLIR